MTPSLSLITSIKKQYPGLYEFLSQLQNTVSSTSATVTQLASTTAPQPVTYVALSQEPYVTENNNLDLLVSVTFLPPKSSNWSALQVYVKNYLGNPSYVYLAEGNTSPLSFLMEMTGENVTFQFVSLNSNGETNLGSGPTLTATLNAVTTTPPSPSIATAETANATGFAFAFNVISGLEYDVIQCYNIYRGTSDNPSDASIVQVIPSSTIENTIYDFQDVISSVDTLYYWVSAVNTSGVESALTPAFGLTIPFDGSMGTVPLATSQVFGVTNNQTTTPSYTSGSISDFLSQDDTTEQNLTYNTWVSVAGVDFTPDNGEVLILLQFWINNTSDNQVGINARLLKNGIQLGSTFGPAQIAASEPGAAMFYVMDASPGDTENTYELQLNLQLDVTNAVEYTQSLITTLNIKA